MAENERPRCDICGRRSWVIWTGRLPNVQIAARSQSPERCITHDRDAYYQELEAVPPDKLRYVADRKRLYEHRADANPRGRGKRRRWPLPTPIEDTPENVARVALSAPPPSESEWEYFGDQPESR